jgi:hypothetical protein
LILYIEARLRSKRNRSFSLNLESNELIQTLSELVAQILRKPHPNVGRKYVRSADIRGAEWKWFVFSSEILVIEKYMFLTKLIRMERARTFLSFHHILCLTARAPLLNAVAWPAMTSVLLTNEPICSLCSGSARHSAP